MGKVVEKIKITNIYDSTKQEEVDALIDTGATMVSLPQNLVDKLGLTKVGIRKVRYADARVRKRPLYRGIILEIKGREQICDVLAEADGSEPIVGQVVLEVLDLLVDPKTRKVIVNPRSPDIPMVELI